MILQRYVCFISKSDLKNESIDGDVKTFIAKCL